MTVRTTCLDCDSPINQPPGRGGRRLRCEKCVNTKKVDAAKRWHAKNPEWVKAYNAAWYTKNRQHDPEWHHKNSRRAKRWRKENAEWVKTYNATVRP